MHSRSSRVCLSLFCWWLARGMAPHLTSAELDFIHEKKQAGLTPVQIHTRLAAQRANKKIETPHLTNIRRALKGKVYKRGRVETRGRQPTFSRAMILRMDVTRKKLIKKADNQREVRWNDIRRSARVPHGHRSTLSRAFCRENIPVAARRPREKPQRTAEHEAERLRFAQDHTTCCISESFGGICVGFNSMTASPSCLIACFLLARLCWFALSVLAFEVRRW